MTNAGLGTRTIPYEYGGVTYQMSEFDLEDYGHFENWLEQNIWTALKRARTLAWITEADYRDFTREALKVLGAREMSFGSDGFIRGTQSVPGIEHQLLLSLRHKHPDISPALVHEMVMKDSKGVIEAMEKLSVPT